MTVTQFFKYMKLYQYSMHHAIIRKYYYTSSRVIKT